MSERQPVSAFPLARGAAALLVLLAAAALPWLGPVPLVLAAAGVLRTSGAPELVRAPVLGGALLLVVSHLATEDPWASLESLASWALIALSYAAGAGLVRRDLSGTLTAGLGAFGVAWAAWSWWQLLVIHPRLLASVDEARTGLVAQLADGRANGPFLLPGHFGALQAALVVLLFGAVLAARAAGRPRQALVAGAGLALVFSGLLASRSLVAAALLGGALTLIGLVALRGRARVWLVGGSAALAAVVLLLFAGSRAEALRRESPLEARRLNWTAASRLVAERPVAGWGGGGIAREYGRVRPPGANEARHAHQAWLEAAAEHGTAFALLLLWPVAGLARGAWRVAQDASTPALRWRRAGFLAAGFVLVGHGLADFGWSRPEWFVLAGLLLGAALTLAGRDAGEGTGRGLRADEALAALCLAGLVVLVAADASTERRALERARELGAEGRHAAAAAVAAEGARAVTGSSELSAVEARALLAAGRSSEAVAASEEAVRRSPRRSVLHAIRAQALLAEGRRLEAWLAAERAAALAPTVPERVELRDALRPARRVP